MNTTHTRVRDLLPALGAVLTLAGHATTLAILLGDEAGAGSSRVGIARRERIAAALAHLCLALNAVTVVGGFVAVVVLRGLAPCAHGYQAAQARQAMLWQLQMWAASVALAVAVHLLCTGWMQLLVVPFELALWGSALLYALYAALVCLRGQPFRYPPWR